METKEEIKEEIKKTILDDNHKFKIVATDKEELEKKFKSIELSLDLLSHNYGPESFDVGIAQDYLNDGDIEGAYNSLSSTVYFDDLIDEIKQLKAKLLKEH